MYEEGADRLRYSSCGHEHILVARTAKKSLDGKVDLPDVEVLKAGGIIMGMVEEITPFLEEKEICLNGGDKILLYTDGATEARKPAGQMYGMRRLVESFRKGASFPIKETVYNIFEDVKRFISEGHQYDDITMVGIERE